MVKLVVQGANLADFRAQVAPAFCEQHELQYYDATLLTDGFEVLFLYKEPHSPVTAHVIADHMLDTLPYDQASITIPFSARGSVILKQQTDDA